MDMENRQPSDTENSTKGLPSKANLILRIIAGCYLLYLTYGIKDSIFQGEGTRQVIFLLFGILFLSAALFLLFFSVRRLLNGQYVEAAAAMEEFKEQQRDIHETAEMKEDGEERVDDKPERP